MSTIGPFPADIWRYLFHSYPLLVGKAQCLSKQFHLLTVSVFDAVSVLPISMSEILSLAKEEENFYVMYWERDKETLHVCGYTFGGQEPCEACEYILTLTPHIQLSKRITATYDMRFRALVVGGIDKFDDLPTSFFSPEELTYEGIKEELCNKQLLVSLSTANAIYSRRGSCIKLLGTDYPEEMTNQYKRKIANMFPQALPSHWYPLLIPMMYQCLEALASASNIPTKMRQHSHWYFIRDYSEGSILRPDLIDRSANANEWNRVKIVWERLQSCYEYEGRPCFDRASGYRW